LTDPSSPTQFQKIFAIALPERTDQRDALALTGAFTGLDIDIVDGVTSWSDKALPPNTADANHPKGVIGAWRAHMNILQTMVNENISSALIMEGDVDWDMRLKSQMHTFARASRMLLQPLRGSDDRFLDPTYPTSEAGDVHQDFGLQDDVVKEPTTSPYGDLDRWDVLWLGHCGSEFPTRADDHGSAPLGRVIISSDETVPEIQHLDREWGAGEYLDVYPPHTRVVSRTRGSVCSLAYAVTQRGARKILYEIGLKSFPMAYDLTLRTVCDGIDGRPMATCLTSQPALFNSHRPVGSRAAMSNIGDHEGWNDLAITVNIRMSARVNLPKLVHGQTDFVDSLPNGKDRPYKH
jgi:hypothetical protein